MNLNEIHKDIFTVDKTYHLAHCIASDFRMGAGIAVKFQNRFKLREKLNNTTSYTNPGTCVLIGKVFNLITKKKSSGKPTYESLESSLLNMKTLVEFYNIKKIAMPKIGCGLDRLSWGRVKEMIFEIFEELDVEILVCNWR